MSILLSLLLSLHSQAACVNIVPGKSIGALEIGQPFPNGPVAGFALEPDSISNEWKSAGPYRFHKNKNGVVDLIQYDPLERGGCYSMKEKKLNPGQNFESLKKELGPCEEVRGWPDNSLYCDGMVWMPGSFRNFKRPGSRTWRVDVENISLRQHQENWAASKVRSVLENEWPYLGSRNGGQPKWHLK